MANIKFNIIFVACFLCSICESYAFNESLYSLVQSEPLSSSQEILDSRSPRKSKFLEDGTLVLLAGKSFQAIKSVDTYIDNSLRQSDKTNNIRKDNIYKISGNLEFSKNSGSSVPNCGPSPLSPDEIKILVENSARRNNVDALFATAIAWVESKFDRSRNSVKGARGPMQLMPDTARRFGVDDVCDPKTNIEGGVKYLRTLLDEFQNPLLVAAAYNAGEGRIYEYGGIPPFKETVGYVAKVVNYQLGAPIKKPDNKVGHGSPKSTSVADLPRETGVIAVKKTGTFVGGVMHF